MSESNPSLPSPPYEMLGGEIAVRALVERFYDVMSTQEPALAKLHPCDERGHVARESRDKFALFLIGWLGGPQEYMRIHGHPRLRMRHGAVPIGTEMRDAWLRSMKAALDAQGVSGELRAFLDSRLGDLADFLRNRPGT